MPEALRRRGVVSGARMETVTATGLEEVGSWYESALVAGPAAFRMMTCERRGHAKRHAGGRLQHPQTRV